MPGSKQKVEVLKANLSRNDSRDMGDGLQMGQKGRK